MYWGAGKLGYLLYIIFIFFSSVLGARLQHVLGGFVFFHCFIFFFFIIFIRYFLILPCFLMFLHFSILFYLLICGSIISIFCYFLLFFLCFLIFPIFLMFPYFGFGCGGMPNLYTKISYNSINICFFSVYIIFMKYTRHE